MERLIQAVRELERTASIPSQERQLQLIGDMLLTGYCLELPGYPRLLPLWVEAYYYSPEKFPDLSCHRTPLQKDRFGKLYFHTRGYGGVDVCLSLGDYCLSWLIKYSLLGNEFCSQVALRKRLDALHGYDGPVLAPLAEDKRPRDAIYHSPRVGLGPGEFQHSRLASLRGLGRYPFRFARGFGMRALLREQQGKSE